MPPCRRLLTFGIQSFAMPDQITSSVIMIRPASFGYNAETAANNAFQQATDVAVTDLANRARAEFDGLVETLRREGIDVMVVEDTMDPAKPDAVFPNNWISLHQNGAVVTYPMFSRLRRLERRQDIIDRLAEDFHVGQRVHFESWEDNEAYLEGTGSMILDRQHRIAYACTSVRTDGELLRTWCAEMGYQPVLFDAVLHGQPIYHTNVMMAIGEGIAVICLEVIPEDQRERVILQLQRSGHDVVLLSATQVDEFAGNMLALRAGDGRQVMVMSTRAYRSLIPEQVEAIGRHARIVHADVSNIELAGGGSVRCMIAENFLPRIEK